MRSRPFLRCARLCVPAALALLFLPSCASTKLTSEWRDPLFGGPLKKVAVFVLSKDESRRRFAEDQAARSMPEGTQAIASYTLFEKLDGDREKVKARLLSEGFDGALAVRPVSVERTQTYVPPRAYLSPGGPYYGRAPYYNSFHGYYGHASGYIEPGYVEEKVVVLMEILLFSLQDEKPVWTAVSETVNPGSTNDLVQGIVKILGKKLEEARLIGKR